MRRLLASAALITMAALVSGCAMTDYCNNDACTDRVGDLLEEGTALGCAHSSLLPQGNAQRPVLDALGLGTSGEINVPRFAAYNYCGNRLLPANNCQSAGTFGPPTCANPAGLVGNDRAAMWMQNLGAQAFLAEAQVFGGPMSTGTWVMGGVKQLHVVCDPATGDPIVPPGGGGGGGVTCGNNDQKVVICHRPPGNPGNQHDLCVGPSAECAHLVNHEDDTSGYCGAPPPPPGGGDPPGWKSLRLSTFGTPAPGVTGSFSCSATNFDGNDASTEGQLMGEGFPGGRIPGLQLQVVAIDNGVGVQFGRNIRAWTPDFDTGFNVFVGGLGRFGEGRNRLVTPSAGLQELFGGAEKTISFPGNPFQMTITAGIREDGMMDMQVHRMKWEQQEITFPTPMLMAANLSLQAWEFGRAGHEDEQTLIRARAMEWMANTMLADTEVFTLDGPIPELGLTFPGLVLNVSREGFLRMADDIYASEDRRRR